MRVGRGPGSAPLCVQITPALQPCAPTARVHSSDKSQQNNLGSFFSAEQRGLNVLPPPLLLGGENCGVILSVRPTAASVKEAGKIVEVEETKKDERSREDNPPLLLAGNCDRSRGEHHSGRQ